VAPDTLDERPTWRGVLHRWAAITFVPLFVVLVVLADETGDRIALIVYAVGVTAMLGVSAIYHSGRVSPAALRQLKRADHSTILLAIAGSYTAVATVGLDGDPSRRLLVAIWIAAPIGVAVRLLWLHAPYPVVAVVYVIVGWLAVIEWRALVDALDGLELGLLVAGGLLYTVGSVVYALHRPNPIPGVFGYHEVFHALVVAGAASHYAMTLALVVG
jgi:hemolysin III